MTTAQNAFGAALAAAAVAAAIVGLHHWLRPQLNGNAANALAARGDRLSRIEEIRKDDPLAETAALPPPRVIRAIPIRKKPAAPEPPAPEQNFARPAAQAMEQMRQQILDRDQLATTLLAPDNPDPAVQQLRPPSQLPPHARLFQNDAKPPPLVNPDAHPVKAETLPSQVHQPVFRPRRHKIAETEDDGPSRRHDGVCAKYGGHKVTFTRHHHESWRCIYPRRHRDD